VLEARGTSWKWAWFDGYTRHPESKAAISWARQVFRVAEPRQTQLCRVNSVKPNDRLLTVLLTSSGAVGAIRWMYVNQVVRVSPSEKQIYRRDCPRQAVQAQPLRMCPRMPFDIDSRFRQALKAAAREWGEERLRRQVDDKPPTKAFLDAILRHWKTSPA
jgi:hypothetical protein